MKTKQKTASLEELVESYLKDKESYQGADSYETYVKLKGKNPERAYFEGVSRLTSQRRRSGAGYGQRAESLANLGLSQSGYAKHLENLATRQYQEGVSSLESDFREENDALKSGYLKYLGEYLQKQNKLVADVTDRITRYGYIDPNLAYQYALSSGLSENNAKLASNSGTAAARRSLLKKVLKEISEMGLSADSARAYAKSLGLTDTDADKASEYAEKFLTDYTDVPDSLLGYLGNNS